MNEGKIGKHRDFGWKDRWEDNTKVDVRERRWVIMDCINLVQNTK
jgi:hypothetical protein